MDRHDILNGKFNGILSAGLDNTRVWYILWYGVRIWSSKDRISLKPVSNTHTGPELIGCCNYRICFKDINWWLESTCFSKSKRVDNAKTNSFCRKTRVEQLDQKQSFYLGGRYLSRLVYFENRVHLFHSFLIVYYLHNCLLFLFSTGRNVSSSNSGIRWFVLTIWLSAKASSW